MVRKLFFLIGFIFATFYVSPSFAFEFSPMDTEIYPHNGENHKIYTVSNPHDIKYAIKFYVFERTKKINGENILNSTNEISISHPAIVLEPKSKKHIQVKWTGQLGTKEKSFFINAKQVPIKFQTTEGRGALKFVLSYKNALYVVPRGAAHNLSLVKTGNKNTVRVRNSGTKHKIIDEEDVERLLASSGLSKNKAQKAKKALIGENVLADSEREFNYEQ